MSSSQTTVFNDLAAAVVANDLKTVRFLIQCGVVNINGDPTDGCKHFRVVGAGDLSMIAWVAWQGDLDMLTLLIKGGADVNKVGRGMASAIIHAVVNDDIEKVKILLKAGANPLAPLWDGSSANALAKANHPEIYQMISAHLKRRKQGVKNHKRRAK